MAHIQLPEFNEMAPRIQEQVKPMMKKEGEVSEIHRLLALQENVFLHTNDMGKAYLFAETELPFSTKERIAILISMENSCKMCVGMHATIAKNLGMSEKQVNEVLVGIDNIECSEEEQILLRFCVRASKKDSYKMLSSELSMVEAAGYSPSQILEAVSIAAYFNYINTIVNAFGLNQ